MLWLKFANHSTEELRAGHQPRAEINEGFEEKMATV